MLGSDENNSELIIKKLKKKSFWNAYQWKIFRIYGVNAFCNFSNCQSVLNLASLHTHTHVGWF